MDQQEFIDIANSLEKYHTIFSKLWSMGVPRFSDRQPTAAVSFDKIGRNIEFVINEDYWNSISYTKKLFIICHEVLHVVLNHGWRMQQALYKNSILLNKALDIPINHALVNRFGFDRSEIDPPNPENRHFCWTDTVFPGMIVEDFRSFEYYYALLLDHVEFQFLINSPFSINDHSGLSSIDGNSLDEILDELTKQLSPQDMEELKDFVDAETSFSKMRGDTPGNIIKHIEKHTVRKNRKWETVIKKWAHMHLIDSDVEQWRIKNKKFRLLGDKLFLPTEYAFDGLEKSRIVVWFFQDTSGSCSEYATRFFKAAESLPKDRFDVRLHCFDTKVYETSLITRELFGFGGTSFHIIEEYIQTKIQNNSSTYPKAVFIITDGYGTAVTPQYPKNWYWFVDGSFSLVPKDSNKFNLKEFE